MKRHLRPSPNVKTRRRGKDVRTAFYQRSVWPHLISVEVLAAVKTGVEMPPKDVDGEAWGQGTHVVVPKSCVER